MLYCREWGRRRRAGRQPLGSGGGETATPPPPLREMVSVTAAGGAEREHGNGKHRSPRAAGQERSAERRGTGQCDAGSTARSATGSAYPTLCLRLLVIGLMGQKLKCCSWAIWATTRAMAPVALVLGPPMLPRYKSQSFP